MIEAIPQRKFPQVPNLLSLPRGEVVDAIECGPMEARKLWRRKEAENLIAVAELSKIPNS